MGGHCDYGREELKRFDTYPERSAYERLVSQLSNRAIGELLEQTYKSDNKFRVYEVEAIRAEAVKRLTKV